MAIVGDVTVTGGSGQTYTLNFGVNAMCRLEALDSQRRKYRQILGEMQTGDPSMQTIRTVVAAALTRPASPTLEQAGDVIEDIGGVLVVLQAFVQSDQAIVDAVTDPVTSQVEAVN